MGKAFPNRCTLSTSPGNGDRVRRTQRLERTETIRQAQVDLTHPKSDQAPVNATSDLLG